MKRSAFEVVIGIALIGFIVLTYLVYKGINTYFLFDLGITVMVQNIHSTLFDISMKFLTFLGNAIPSITLTIISTCILFIYKWKKEAVALFISSFGAITLCQVLKTIIARPRPSADLVRQVTHYIKHDSFPSGHVLFYIGFFGFLLFLAFSLKRKSLLKIFSIIILTLMIIFIGVSRIYLGAHWFSDVVGAYLIGVVWLGIITKLYQMDKFSFFK